uniref:Uncharacterized protein n=1 Tax=Arundo donax TaxID=35708 RepID=A0A0A9HET6_ARUDO
MNLKTKVLAQVLLLSLDAMAASCLSAAMQFFHLTRLRLCPEIIAGMQIVTMFIIPSE